MDSQPGLISSVIYTYLSLLPFHVGPSLANLKEQETQMTVSLIRTRVRQLELSLSLFLSLPPLLSHLLSLTSFLPLTLFLILHLCVYMYLFTNCTPQYTHVHVQ